MVRVWPVNAKQRRVARRAAKRRSDAEPSFLLDAFGRTFAASAAETRKANRLIVEDITVELDTR
jgi:hypothetical protein